MNGECDAMVDMTLKRPLSKGQGHSFRYQSISHIRMGHVIQARNLHTYEVAPLY